MDNDEISYDGIDEAELLFALYHGTRPLGLGALHDLPGFSRDTARSVIASRPAGERVLWFDYVAGRPIKVGLDTTTKTIKRADLYDRDAGAGATRAIVDELHRLAERLS